MPSHLTQRSYQELRAELLELLIGHQRVTDLDRPTCKPQEAKTP